MAGSRNLRVDDSDPGAVFCLPVCDHWSRSRWEVARGCDWAQRSEVLPGNDSIVTARMVALLPIQQTGRSLSGADSAIAGDTGPTAARATPLAFADFHFAKVRPPRCGTAT